MEKGSVASESETVLIQPLRMTTGHLSVIANADTPEQTFPLQEGVYIIGRKSKASTATIGIVTADKSMSREHIRIEVKKMPKEAINIIFLTIIVKIIRYIIAIT